MKYRLRNRFLVLLHEKERKLDRRITQKEIAQETGISAHTIGSWVRNEVTKFEAPILARLCEYFECQVGDLLYLEEIE
jgi:DNA-binding Xre family transcriptional regulator